MFNILFNLGMDHRKPILFIVALAVFLRLLNPSGFPQSKEANENFLTLPVRVVSDSRMEFDLLKEDFEFFINNEMRPIHTLRRGRRSLSIKTALGRNFILSFQLAEYREEIIDAVSLFTTQYITPADVLIIVTPLKIYPLEVTVNKEKLIGRIEKILKYDLNEYHKQRTAMEKNLENALERARASFSDDFESQKYGVYQYQEAVRFLNTFPKEFSNFKKRFLIPHGGQYEKIAALFGERGGERWWIHFQLRELSPLFSKIRRVIGVLREWEGFSSSVLPYEQGFDHLKKQLIFGDSFNVDKYLTVLLAADVCYNIILLGQHVEVDATHKQMADLETLLSKLVNESGGHMVSVSDPNVGIREIYNHQDRFYEILFPFDGGFEEKKIRINVNRAHVRPIYRDLLNRADIELLLAARKSDGPRVVDFTFDGRVIHFSIQNFKRNPTEKFGILKVMIELFNQKRKRMYKTENTLRAVKEQISVTLPLPSSIKGNHILKITTLDLIANRLSEEELPVQLQ